MLLAQKETPIGKLIWGFVYECVSVRMYSWLAVSASTNLSMVGISVSCRFHWKIQFGKNAQTHKEAKKKMKKVMKHFVFQ